MHIFDCIVVGELNVDLILDDIQSFPHLGKEILAQKMGLVLGSSSAILASNLSSLGLKVAFVGKVGKDDFGDFVMDCLRGNDVATEFVIRDEKVKTGATIILNYPDDRAMVTHKGAMDALTIKDVTPDMLKNAGHLHYSSYYLQDGMRKDTPELFQMAKSQGLTTSFDTNWDPAEKWGDEILDVLTFVDVFLPNHEEATHISKQPSVESALQELSKYAKTVAIKWGRYGAIANWDSDVVKVEAFEVKQVDAVGAGDSFNAGFIYRFLEKADLRECMTFGNACGALSVTQAGGTAAFQSAQQIEKDMEEIFSYKTTI